MVSHVRKFTPIEHNLWRKQALRYAALNTLPGLWSTTTRQTIPRVYPEPVEEPQDLQGNQRYSRALGHQQIRAMVPQAPPASHSRTEKSSGPRTEPCGTPLSTACRNERLSHTNTLFPSIHWRA
ncbi:unnamed protein product [Dicrocoelium dendriticum]|nr:unnamed protein product [Dicrocoelium dendriticum]